MVQPCNKLFVDQIGVKCFCPKHHRRHLNLGWCSLPLWFCQALPTYAIGCSSPSCTWNSTAATSVVLASVSRTNGRSSLGNASMGASHRAVLRYRRISDGQCTTQIYVPSPQVWREELQVLQSPVWTFCSNRSLPGEHVPQTLGILLARMRHFSGFNFNPASSMGTRARSNVLSVTVLEVVTDVEQLFGFYPVENSCLVPQLQGCIAVSPHHPQPWTWPSPGCLITQYS